VKLRRRRKCEGPNVVFASTSEDPAAVAARVATATKGFGVSVKDIRQQAAQTVSSITTIDLTGISRLEQAFAIVLAAAAMWLFVNLVVSERRHEFATMAALGASLRDIGAFVRSEAGAVLGAALALAAAVAARSLRRLPLGAILREE
jgi:putative ABC transport system permease protein